MSQTHRIDFLVRPHGTIWLFEPVTDRAKEYTFTVLDVQDWQWDGPALGVDHRVANDLILALEEEGWKVTVEQHRSDNMTDDQQLDRLRQLPQQADVWQLAFEPTPNWLELNGKPMRPWPTSVYSLVHQMDLAEERWCESRPSPEFCWELLVKATEKPDQHPLRAKIEPHRPTELQVRDKALFEALRGPATILGIKLVIKDALEPLDGFLIDLGEDMSGPRIPGLLETPGVTAERVARLFETAAAFHQHLHLPKLRAVTTVDTVGLLKNAWTGFLTDDKKPRYILVNEETPDQTEYLVMGFGDHTDIPVADFEAMQQHGWRIASPEAYPCFFHQVGRAARRPFAWHLDLIEACLLALPRFAAGTESHWTGRVSLGSGHMDMRLGRTP